MQPPEKKVLETPRHSDITETASNENYLKDDDGVTVSHD